MQSLISSLSTWCHNVKQKEQIHSKCLHWTLYFTKFAHFKPHNNSIGSYYRWGAWGSEPCSGYSEPHHNRVWHILHSQFKLCAFCPPLQAALNASSISKGHCVCDGTWMLAGRVSEPGDLGSRPAPSDSEVTFLLWRLTSELRLRGF